MRVRSVNLKKKGWLQEEIVPPGYKKKMIAL
jgi:hypothetical protein